MTCNGICKEYKVKRHKDRFRYKHGHKRCRVCDIFIKFEGLWCPCCNCRLSLRQRNRKRRNDIHD